MDFVIQTLLQDDVERLFPDISRSRKVYAYEVIGETGIRQALAVFYSSSFHQKEAIMYHFSLDTGTGIPNFYNSFFEGCLMKLKEEGFSTVYYKNSGTIEELDAGFDKLVAANFTPIIYLGVQLNYRLGDLFQTTFMKEFDNNKAAQFPVVSFADSFSRQQRAFVNSLAKDDEVLRMSLFTPEYSFLTMTDDAEGGILCMNYAEDGFLLTSMRIQADNKPKRGRILEALLGAFLQKVSGQVAEDTMVRFVFMNRYDEYKARSIFENRETEVLFQEFVREL